MDRHFIKDIDIKDYKCFKNFKTEGFGRVNLIGGKNNVGKTAFMEALCINVYAKDEDTLYTTLMYVAYIREKLEYINKLFTLNDDIAFFENIKIYSSKSNINNISYKLIHKQGIKSYEFMINDYSNSINSQDFSYTRKLNTSILFLDGKGFTNKHLQKIYTEVQRQDKESELNTFIQSFDVNIEKFKIFNDSPECKLKNSNNYIRLNEFGDGLRSYISIISALYACSNSYLFIDEIENGIHYTKFDKLWEIILTISKEQNVQLFLTTHSKEAIESYARVAKKLEDKDITFVELGRDRDDKLKAIVMDNNRFYDELKNGNGVRGW
jgi:AAA15 family ATPase/GTPase